MSYRASDPECPHYKRLCRALGGEVVFIDTGIETVEGEVAETGWIRGSSGCAWWNQAVYHAIHGPKNTRFYGGYPVVYPVRASILPLLHLETTAKKGEDGGEEVVAPRRPSRPEWRGL